jgi:ElaB/YqjD/DUF883 family membrane-anchored ribosome-binding protein
MKRSESLDTLICDVEELLAALSDVQQPAIKELRCRIKNEIDSARSAEESASARIGRYAKSVDHYITGYPRLGFLTGLAVGGLIVHGAGLFGSSE